MEVEIKIGLPDDEASPPSSRPASSSTPRHSIKFACFMAGKVLP
uniref:Uncharacterized protein n=1 Tax=Arundo donax TaxID=35708 RepID=A0A0A9A7D1_ARUDO